MFCEKCGSQVPDGTKFCTTCGEPLAQPAAAAKTQMDLILTIIGIVGAFFTFLASFLPWVTVKIGSGKYSISESAGLFKLEGFQVFSAVLILLGSLVLIAWEVANLIPVVADIKNKIGKLGSIIRLVVVIVVIFLIILQMILKGGCPVLLRDITHLAAGAWLGFVGSLILIAQPIVKKFVK